MMLPPFEVVQQTQDSAILRFAVAAEWPYFSGHFPGMPILPGVAQIGLVVAMASEVFGSPLTISSIRQLKFQQVIMPDAILQLVLSLQAGKLTFRLCAAENEAQVMASGQMLVAAI